MSEEMKSDGVPEDIQRAATRIAGNYLGFNVSCAAIYRDVVEALMAEREAQKERDAMIADEYPAQVLQFWDRPGGPPGNGYRAATAKDVAAAIRKGQP